MADDRTLAPPTPAEADASTTTRRPTAARLIGVDLARALAVFGMYAVHVGPPASAVGGIGGRLLDLAEGRASALFALLAGFSVMIIAGRHEPRNGRPFRQARARIALRALVLVVAGPALTLVAGDVVILAYYGVYFLLTLPVLRWGGRALALLAAGLAVVTPLLQLGLQQLITPAVQTAVDRVDPLERISGVGVLDLLVTGFYPTVTWMTFVVAGMALARTDLSRVDVRRRVAAVGAALVAFGYGIPALLVRVVGGGLARAAHEPWGRDAEALENAASSAPPEIGGTGPDWGLLLPRPHSGSTFDLVGCTGIAVLAVVGCLVAMDQLPRVRWALTPVIAVGTMSLTAYVGHFLAPTLLGVPFGSDRSVLPLLGYVAAAVAFAFVWSRFSRRGPLEQVLHLTTRPAARVR